MSQDEFIGVHVSSSLKRDIQEIAGSEATSVYVRKLLKQHVIEKKADDIDREAKAEEKIEKVAQKATDQIEEEVKKLNTTARQLQQLMGRSGAYSVANYELLKYQHDIPEGMRDDARKTGARRLSKDFLEGVELSPADIGIADDDTETEDSAAMPWDDSEGHNE